MSQTFLERINTIFEKPWLDHKVGLFRLLAITQNAWLGIRDSLKVIMISEKHKWMQQILEWMLIKINEWLSFSESMLDFDYFFSGQEIALIKSAEAMGNLPDVLLWVALDLEANQKLQGKVKSAMTYPSVILVFAIAAVIILLVKVMPTIVSLFPNETSLPLITRIMLGVSDFLIEKWYILVISIVAIVGGYIYSYHYILPFKMFIDKMLLNMPVVWNLVKKTSSPKIFKTYGWLFWCRN